MGLHACVRVFVGVCSQMAQNSKRDFKKVCHRLWRIDLKVIAGQMMLLQVWISSSLLLDRFYELSILQMQSHPF